VIGRDNISDATIIIDSSDMLRSKFIAVELGWKEDK
jgi:hypothetical protein